MNVKDGWPPGSKKFFTDSILASMLNGEMSTELLARIAEVPNEPQQTKRLAVAKFKTTLRGLVDQWIESGKCKGIDDAWQRNVNWKTGEQPPLIEILLGYQHRNPPKAKPAADGRFDVWMLPAHIRSKKPMLRACDMAIYCFIVLMDSPTRERFSRCDACSSYFVRVRMPKKDLPIFHGSFCPKCKTKGSARRTRVSREDRTQERIGWAADAMEQWRPGNRFGNEIDWIVKKVNASQKAVGRDPIKSNWVNWHLREIKAKVERRKHAKG